MVEVESDRGLLIFDGDCGFCTWSADWVSRRWPPGPRTVPWQRMPPESLAAAGLTAAESAKAAWWVDSTSRAYRGHRAIAKSLIACGGVYRVIGTVIDVPPGSWLAAVIYPIVTRNRHRQPGGTPACRITLEE